MCSCRADLQILVVDMLLVCVCLCLCYVMIYLCLSVFFFQAEDGIRDLVRSRGLGDVYKRQSLHHSLQDPA